MLGAGGVWVGDVEMSPAEGSDIRRRRSSRAAPGDHPASGAAAAAARRSGVRDGRVLAAMASVDRAGFVRASDRGFIDADRPLRIGHGQTTSQPSLIASMVEALELTGHERVLEVGTGLGYQAAILAHLAAEVVSVERVTELAEQAGRNLAAAGIDNVEVVTGDGSHGLAEHGPFDAAILAAVAPEVPAALVAQVVEGGRIVAPVSGSGVEEAVVFVVESGRLRRVRRIAAVRFVPLVSGPDDWPDE